MRAPNRSTSSGSRSRSGSATRRSRMAARRVAQLCAGCNPGSGSRACTPIPGAYIRGQLEPEMNRDTAQLDGRRRQDAPIYGPEAFEGMRRAGRLTAQGLDLLAEHVKPGVTTEFLDKLAFQFAMDHGAYPATLFYRGYTKSICTSINHVVCHGIPSDKPLREGDILNIDYTVILDGWHGDSSRMFFVGEVPRRAARLCDITFEAMLRGIAAGRAGGSTQDIRAPNQNF